MSLTEKHELHTGKVPWQVSTPDLSRHCSFPTETVDVAIVGAGITGATIAERLSASGLQVALFDRRKPGQGSTAASTAEVMWAMDLSLLQLSQQLGEHEAARRWVRVFNSVRAFAKRIDALGLHVARVERPTVYLAGNVLDEAALQQEAELHRRYQLPTEYLDARTLGARFGITPRAGLVSAGSFEVDPVRLTDALLQLALRQGATLTFPIDIVGLEAAASGNSVLYAADGRSVEARQVVLATGYERATEYLPAAFSLLSTFVIETAPMAVLPWREQAMIWEASDPYLYLRTNASHRLIAGGEDIDSADAANRDNLLPDKTRALAEKLQRLLACEPLVVERSWAATFGHSPDSLPAIGRAATLSNVWLTAGYGGNGLAFAALAAEILDTELSGERDADLSCFDPQRFGSN